MGSLKLFKNSGSDLQIRDAATLIVLGGVTRFYFLLYWDAIFLAAGSYTAGKLFSFLLDT